LFMAVAEAGNKAGSLPFDRHAWSKGNEGMDQDQGWAQGSKNDACISDIFISPNESSYLNEHLIVYPGVTLVRNRLAYGSGRQVDGERKKRGKIVDFSNKSRCNMKVTMAKLKHCPEGWQDFTFADDLMEGKTVSEKAKFAAKCMWSFQRWCEKYGVSVNGIWKKEWKKRRSGRLKGEMVPHYHMVFSIPGADEEMYLWVFKRFAREWVEITGTKEKDKALRVALHEKSYRLITSTKQMQAYMSKYIGKDEGFVFTESIGRNWGKIGDPLEADGRVIEMTFRDMVLFKRILRKLAKKGRKSFKNRLKEMYSRFFMFLEERTVDRIIEYIDSSQGIEAVPF